MAMQQLPRANTLQILSKSLCAMAPDQVRGQAPSPPGRGEDVAGRPDLAHREATPPNGSKSRRTLDLIVPVKAHVFDDAIAHHDDSALRAGIGGVLVQRERRDVDIVAAGPLVFLRCLGPLPLEGFEAIPF